MADVRAELDGKYILKPKYAPAAPPPDAPEVSVDEPSAKIPPHRRVTRHSPCPYVTPEAQRYLDGV
jgi:hypothetical protein